MFACNQNVSVNCWFICWFRCCHGTCLQNWLWNHLSKEVIAHLNVKYYLNFVCMWNPTWIGYTNTVLINWVEQWICCKERWTLFSLSSSIRCPPEFDLLFQKSYRMIWLNSNSMIENSVRFKRMEFQGIPLKKETEIPLSVKVRIFLLK